jgi:hypothetical protein
MKSQLNFKISKFILGQTDGLFWRAWENRYPVDNAIQLLNNCPLKRKSNQIFVIFLKNNTFVQFVLAKRCP